MKDLTKGKPSALILSFALPVFLGNLLQLTYSLVDTRIVGTFLKEDALAAVGATSALSGLIIGFLLGLANGFAIITAQKFGAGKKESVRKSSDDGKRNCITSDSYRTSVSTPDPYILKCAGASGKYGCTVYFYYYCRYAGNISLRCLCCVVACVGRYGYAVNDPGGICGFKYCRRSVFYTGSEGRSPGSGHCHGAFTGTGISGVLVLYGSQI